MSEEEKVYRLDDVYYGYEKYLHDFDPAPARQPTLENTSFYAEEEDGCLYHYCGNTRIKVNEHFSDHGRVVGALIENVILHSARRKE